MAVIQRRNITSVIEERVGVMKGKARDLETLKKIVRGCSWSGGKVPGKKNQLKL